MSTREDNTKDQAAQAPIEIQATTRDGVEIWKDADGWLWLRMGTNEICLTPQEIPTLAAVMGMKGGAA